MKRSFPFLAAVCISRCLFAQNVESKTDSIAHEFYLQEVVVQADYLTIKDDHIVGMPTYQQRKHSHNGYDILRNMMIPGVTVDKKDGTVSTPQGNATVYINGREVTFREVQSLRPKDIANIEYYDLPTGKFAKDAASINFILKTPQEGGYTQVDAKQGAGFLLGDYNGISKYSFKNYNINIWTGYSVNKPKTDTEEVETYSFPEQDITKTEIYNNGSDHSTNKYGIISVSQISNKRIWMIRGGIENNIRSNDIEQGSIGYTDLSSTMSFTQHEKLNSLKPTLYAYFRKTFSNKNNLDIVLDSYYSRNKYKRDYMEQNASYLSDTDEDYYYTKLNANYMTVLPNKGQLTFSIHEYLHISQSTYLANPDIWQHLHSSETILFADYNKRLGKSFMLDINPGLSYLAYHLHGDNSIKHLTPRLNISAAYLISKTQRLQMRFALGNTYPSLNTVNHVDQQLDRFMIRRGNADMDNSLILQPYLYYTHNIKKVSLGVSGQYTYYSNAIVNDYYVEKNNTINSFSSDAHYHGISLNLSATYKPSPTFNLKADGGYKNTNIRGCMREHQDTWKAGLQANYYVNDFSFSLSCQTPKKELVNNLLYVRTPWLYDISTDWTHKNFSLELTANNLFLNKNKVVQKINSNIYKFSSSSVGDLQNQYFTVKTIFTIDYGKKVNQSPKYNKTTSESAILKGKI